MRRHGEVSSDDDATTPRVGRPLTGSPIRSLGASPNYLRRRVLLGVTVLAFVAFVIGVVAVISDAGEAEGPASDEFALDRPIATAVQVPISQELVTPTHHGYNSDVLYVALYGSIGTDRLGVLGERDVAGSVAHAADVAADYDGFAKTVVPTFEIIASIASFEPGDDVDYSNETPIAQLQPWVDAADQAGYHVVLDLQPGRQRFPSQITEFEALLLQPHVSVALDPEWRVGLDEIPEGGKVGTVTADEVNTTVAYLDRIIEENDLPPKMMIVHQFKNDMISDKLDIRGTENVQIVIHMDGFGTLGLKRETYAQITSDLPPGAVVGWKNFYDEDEPTPTPAETMDNDPVPMFVSFQ